MTTYTVLYTEDVPHYATREVQAATVDGAIRAARAEAAVDLDNDDPDWKNPILRRIVHIEDDQGNTVATDIPLDGMFLLTNFGPIRDAIRYALESLGAFKADWLANHGLNVVVEKLDAAYIEVGDAA